MRIIVAGSRAIQNYSLVSNIIDDALRTFSVTLRDVVIVSGCALGVDSDAIRWATANNVKCERYPADWSRGKGAGMMRNSLMADNADALVLIWDGKSKGSAHMKLCAEKLNLLLHECITTVTPKKQHAFQYEDL